MSDNVVLIPGPEPQCPYLIDDGVVINKYGQTRGQWRCQGDRAHDGPHILPASNDASIVTRGDWHLPDYVLPHEV